MCPASLQGGGADEGRVGVPGPLCGQIPGPSREAGTQTDRAVGPGRGDDEEGGCGQRVETLQMENKWSTECMSVSGPGWGSACLPCLRGETLIGGWGVICWGNENNKR